MGVFKPNLASGETTAVPGEVSEASAAAAKAAVAARLPLVVLAGVVRRNLPKGVARGLLGETLLYFVAALSISSYQANSAYQHRSASSEVSPNQAAGNQASYSRTVQQSLQKQ